jgi:hypothetical protein
MFFSPNRAVFQIPISIFPRAASAGAGNWVVHVIDPPFFEPHSGSSHMHFVLAKALYKMLCTLDWPISEWQMSNYRGAKKKYINMPRFRRFAKETSKCAIRSARLANNS